MEIKTLLFENTPISYKLYGSGETVVFIHGFGEDSSIWEDQVKFLEGKYRLILPDIPGSGKSAMLKGNNREISDYAEVINEILNEEKIKTTVIIGHSMGGYIGLAFAKKYPERLKALGLFHSGAYADSAEKKEARKKSIKFIESNGSRSFLSSVTPGLFYDSEKSKSVIDELVEKGENFLPQVLIQYYQAMMNRPDRTSVLIRFEKPILFIIGEHDRAIPFDDSMRQSHLPAHAYIHILRNSSHMGMKEEVNKANLILAQFLHFSNAVPEIGAA